MSSRGVSSRVVRCLCVLVCGAWLARSATLVHPGGSIALALQEAQASGEGEVLVSAGTYSTGDAPVYLTVNSSVHVRGVGGTAVIDCNGNSSGLDVLLSSHMNVTFSDVAFHNCVASAAVRHWEVGPVASWCGACWCGVSFCSTGGAVTITNASAATEVRNASVTFARCNFVGNEADKGGAVALGMFTNLTDSLIHFEDCTFLRNKAVTSGGAAIDVLLDAAYNTQYYTEQELLDRAVPTLDHTVLSVSGCRFEGNHGVTEGSIAFWSLAGYLAGFNFILRHSDFVTNIGGNGPGTAFHIGNTVTDEMNTLLFEGVRFESNIATGKSVGGAILATLPMSQLDPNPPKPLFYRTYHRTVQMISRDTVFKNNSAYIGGAYAISNGRHVFQNVSFDGNRANESGGAICLTCIGGGDSEFMCEDTDFRDNDAHVFGSTFSSQSTGSLSMRNCTFNMLGSSVGVSGFYVNNGGTFSADARSSWRCEASHKLLKTNPSVSWGTSGTLSAKFNSMAIDVKTTRMQLSCLSCPVGRYSHVRPSLKGTVSLYINSTYDPEDIAYEGGTFTDSKCLRCGRGEFLSEGRCNTCPAGRTLGGSASALNEAACGIDMVYWAMAFGLFLLTSMLMLLFPIAAGWPMQVRDISQENGEIVVATNGQHHLLSWPLIRAHAWLRSTGHPVSDRRSAPYLIQVLDSERLVLLDEAGMPVRGRLDSSMGRLWVSVWRAPFCRGFCRLPIALIVLPLGSLALFLSTRLQSWVVLVAFAAGAFVAVLHVLKRHWKTVTPLSRRIWEFRRRVLRHNSSPHACPRGPERAVTVSKLLELHDFFQGWIRDRDMYYVTANLLKPLTEPEQLSYAELVGPSSVKFFVSHFWGTQFRHLVESIRLHAEQASAGCDWQSFAYWICSLSNNQWDVRGELAVKCEESSFYLALRSSSCQGTAMVLDEKALPLTRSWCLFELLQTFLLLDGDSRNDFTGLALCTSHGVLNKGGTGVDIAMGIAHRLAELDLRDATASEPRDKDMIDSCVQNMHGGFPAMNRFVRSNIREALLRVKDSFECDFKGIVAALDGVSDDHQDLSTDGYDLDGRSLQRPTLLTSSARHTGQKEAGGCTPSPPSLDTLSCTADSLAYMV